VTTGVGGGAVQAASPARTAQAASTRRLLDISGVLLVPPARALGESLKGVIRSTLWPSGRETAPRAFAQCENSAKRLELGLLRAASDLKLPEIGARLLRGEGK
jgi:hypothetical protein